MRKWVIAGSSTMGGEGEAEWRRNLDRLLMWKKTNFKLKLNKGEQIALCNFANRANKL